MVNVQTIFEIGMKGTSILVGVLFAIGLIGGIVKYIKLRVQKKIVFTYTGEDDLN